MGNRNLYLAHKEILRPSGVQAHEAFNVLIDRTIRAVLYCMPLGGSSFSSRSRTAGWLI